MAFSCSVINKTFQELVFKIENKYEYTVVDSNWNSVAISLKDTRFGDVISDIKQCPRLVPTIKKEAASFAKNKINQEGLQFYVKADLLSAYVYCKNIGQYWSVEKKMNSKNDQKKIRSPGQAEKALKAEVYFAVKQEASWAFKYSYPVGKNSIDSIVDTLAEDILMSDSKMKGYAALKDIRGTARAVVTSYACQTGQLRRALNSTSCLNFENDINECPFEIKKTSLISNLMAFATNSESNLQTLSNGFNSFDWASLINCAKLIQNSEGPAVTLQQKDEINFIIDNVNHTIVLHRDELRVLRKKNIVEIIEQCFKDNSSVVFLEKATMNSEPLAIIKKDEKLNQIFYLDLKSLKIFRIPSMEDKLSKNSEFRKISFMKSSVNLKKIATSSKISGVIYPFCYVDSKSKFE